MFTLTTDSSIDLFKNELDKLDVPYIPLTFTSDGVTREDRFSSDAEYEDFYAGIKKGVRPVTSQINPASHEEFFEKVCESGGRDIVHLTLSSGLSKTYESACFAAKSFMEKHEGVSIYIVDTLAATMASMPVFEKALALREEGVSAQTAAETLRAYAQRIQVYIIPDNLFHLMRGGRVSAASATVGTVFNVKPVIVFDAQGKLSVYKKAIGFNRALKIILEHIGEYCPDVKNKKIWLAHACAHEQAAAAAKAIEDRFGCTTATGWIGPVIGTHTGAGTIGVVFEANSRLF